MGEPLDLFAAASADGAWTVSEVTRRARAVVENGMTPLWVRGEVTGFKSYRSGHWYFTLRDARAPVRLTVDRATVRRGGSVTALIEVPAATRAILPCSTATSRTPSSPLDGSTILPPFRRRSYIPGLRDP